MNLRQTVISAVVLGLPFSACTTSDVPATTEPNNHGLVAEPVRYEALDTLELFRVSSMQPAADLLLVTEPSAGRVLAFDRSKQTFQVFGRAGQGPGELRSPRYVAANEDRVVVADAGNRSLISYAKATGEYIEGRPFPDPTLFSSFAISDGGTLFAPGGPDNASIEYLVDGDWKPLTADKNVASTVPIGFDLLLRTADELTLIKPDGTFNFYLPTGELIGTDSLPTNIREAAIQAVVSARGAPPGADQPLIKAASSSERGIVGMLVGRPEGILGFLRNEDGRFQEILLGQMTGAAREAIETAVGVAVSGDTLFVASPFGLHAFKLLPRGRNEEGSGVRWP